LRPARRSFCSLRVGRIALLSPSQRAEQKYKEGETQHHARMAFDSAGHADPCDVTVHSSVTVIAHTARSKLKPAAEPPRRPDFSSRLPIDALCMPLSIAIRPGVDLTFDSN